MSIDQLNELPILIWLRWAEEHGIWDLISTVVLFLSALIGFAVIFWSKRRVRNLNFFVRRVRDEDDSSYPLKVYVELRNYTGRSVVLSTPYFMYSKLRPDANARGDSPSREYEVKFPDMKGKLTEVEYLLRHRENVSTWVPVDPTHTDKDVDKAIQQRNVGKLHFMCTWLQDKPKVHELKRRI